MTSTPDGKVLRGAIPSHCFRSQIWLSAWYVVRDLAMASVLFASALRIPTVEFVLARLVLWTAYGFVQGLIFTGIWILAHECGHGALFPTKRLNNPIGFGLHSLLMVPFFSWKFSHARHHRYTNHMEKDTAFVPGEEGGSGIQARIANVLGLAEDAPITTIAALLSHQLVGWPMYLLSYVSAGDKSMPVSSDGQAAKTTRSHFDPWSNIFSSSERFFVLLSDLGLAATLFALWKLSGVVGGTTVLLAYGLPWLWVNHWIVAITFLHHTHPDVHHYRPESWAFTEGALSTVDREFGWIGRHLFHGIIEYHVIHHLFPRIPFYHAEEATQAILPLLGKKYRREDASFMAALWTTFRACQYVTETKGAAGVLEWAH